MIKTGAILLSLYPTAVFPPEWLPSDFREIVRAGKGYKVITSFDGYWQPATSAQFEFVGTPEAFQLWIASDPVKIKSRDIEFGNSLLMEFLTGQKDITLDNATYRAMSETFKYAESALRRGDIPQAKTELNGIALAPPVWTLDAKNYFINKINQYLGI